jgi:hypothetical protein
MAINPFVVEGIPYGNTFVQAFKRDALLVPTQGINEYVIIQGFAIAAAGRSYIVDINGGFLEPVSLFINDSVTTTTYNVVADNNVILTTTQKLITIPPTVIRPGNRLGLTHNKTANGTVDVLFLLRQVHVRELLTF